MGMIVLAGAKVGMEKHLGLRFDECPSGRLRSYAEDNLPELLGVERVLKRKLRTIEPRVSKPGRPKPLKFSDLNTSTQVVDTPARVKLPPAVDDPTARLPNERGKLYPLKTEKDRAVLFLDSGAFSVWTRGITIDVAEYADFLKQVWPRVDYAFNLDVLPGASSRAPTRGEIEDAEAKGFENWRYLRKQGFETIHTFHGGESISTLIRMRDEALAEMKDPYIALGGIAEQRGPSRVRWLADIWRNLVDKDNRPLLKVHGLGVLDFEGVTSFPWASVDGTTWLNGDIYGTILDWVTDSNGQKSIRQIVITFRIKNGRGGWANLCQAERDSIARAFQCSAEEVLALDPKEQSRRVMSHNIRMYKKLESMIPDRLNVGPQPLRLV